MKLRVNSWGRGGLANPGHVSVPGGRGHRLSLDERIAIMRGVDAKLSYAEIGRRLGRDRSVVWREHQRNRNPDGDYHARMAQGCPGFPLNFGGGPRDRQAAITVSSCTDGADGLCGDVLVFERDS